MTVKQDHSVGSSKPSEKTKTLWALFVTLSLALFLIFHHTAETKDHSIGWFHVKQKGSKVRKKKPLGLGSGRILPSLYLVTTQQKQTYTRVQFAG